MISESSQLLKMLGAGVRRTGGAEELAPRAGQGTIEGAAFTELLKQAENGDLSSHRRVSVENGAGVVLNEAQALAVSAAADRAEAAGVRRALVMLDDQALVLDVTTRSIVGKAEFSRGVMNGIDGVVKISSRTSEGGAGNGAAGNVLRVPRASVAELMKLPVMQEE